jgi:hypothetical protein
MKYAMVTATNGAKKRLKMATELKSIAATLAPTVAKRTNRKTLSRSNRSVIFTARPNSSELEVLQVRQWGAVHRRRECGLPGDSEVSLKPACHPRQKQKFSQKPSNSDNWHRIRLLDSRCEHFSLQPRCFGDFVRSPPAIARGVANFAEG